MIDVETALVRATSALALRRPDEARRVLAPVVAADPTNARALLLLGRAAVAAGDIEGGRQLAHRAASQAPGDVELLVGCGYLAYHCGDVAAAYGWGRLAWSGSPGAGAPRRLLALVAARLGLAEEAVAHGRAAVALAPDDPDALVAYAHALSSAQASGAATVQYVSALALDPLHLDALSGLGVERVLCGDMRRCAIYLGRVLELDPSYEYGLDNLDACAASARTTVLGRVAVTGLAAWCASLLGVLSTLIVVFSGAVWIIAGLALLPRVLRRRLLSEWHGRDVGLVVGIAVGLIAFPILVFGVAMLATPALQRVSTAIALRQAGLSLPGRR